MANRRQYQDPKRFRFSCSHHGCAYSFPKSEHLARHERTHSGSKPYACSVCHRRFARNDSLIRHARLHVQNDSSRESEIAVPDGQRHTTDVAITGGQESPVPPWNALHNPLANVAESVHSVSDAITHGAPREDITTQGMVVNDGGIFAMGSDFWHGFLGQGSAMPFYDAFEINTIPAMSGDKSSAKNVSAELIHQAVNCLNGVVHTLPSRLTIQMETGDDCNFSSSLNDYLDLFLAQFSSVLPVIHKSTFNIGETAPSTLLLMLALGSSFLGTPDAISKGEALWKLAHAVATTSWSTMLENRGPWDLCHGVQLVLTAALGQTYALMSRSNKLRTTAQVVHDLGFHWARRCGMYDVEYANRIAAEDNLLPLDSRWRAWAASETQLRAVLAHYLLDGRITQLSGESGCVRHSVNPLPMPVTNAVFEAPDPHAWMFAMSSNEPARITFCDFILALFREDDHPHVKRPLSEFSILVVLECFQSFASERQEAGGDAVGLPSQQEVVDAMTRFYRCQILMQSSEEQNDQALRWHSILGFSICTNIRDICHQLCEVAGTPHPFYPHRKHGCSVSKLADIWNWANCQKGRTALLHSFAICDRITDLRLGHALGIHVPFAAFYAAVTMLAFLSTGNSVIASPVQIEWTASALDGETYGSTKAMRETLSFVNGAASGRSVARNLQVEVLGLRRLLRTLGETWGVCVSMEATLKSLYEAATWLKLVANESFLRESVIADETG